MSDKSELCVKALKYIHQHYAEELTLTLMAELFYVNPAYLGRVFTKQMGVSFNEYLMTYRIKMAMQMLRRQSMSIFEVSKAVGYHNLNYFYRIFKRHTGITPAECRMDMRRYVNHTFHTAKNAGLAEDIDAPALSTAGIIVNNIPVSADADIATGSMIETSVGKIKYYFAEPCEGGSSMMCSGSVDNGATWGRKHAVFDADNEGDLISAPTAMTMQDGSLGMFYTVRDSVDGVTLRHRRSYDEGATWTSERQCANFNGNVTLIGDRITRISSGRLVIPVFRPTIRSAASERRSVISHYISDDEGDDWRIVDMPLVMTSRHSTTGLKYPMVYEQLDGALYGCASTDLGCHYEYGSRDGGNTWSDPQPSLFTSPDSPIHIRRLGHNRLIAAWNPVPNYNTRDARSCRMGRTRLIYCVSTNGGTSWSKPVILENSDGDDGRGYSHPSIYITAEAAYISYMTYGGKDSLTDASISIRRILMPTLTEEASKR